MDFLSVAHRTGKRLARDAIWSGDRCTWLVTTPDLNRRADRAGKTMTAGGGIYQGAAGVGLFLGELASLTDDREIAEASAGALRFAFDWALRLPAANLSFHGGRSGIGYILARLACLTERDELAAQARAVIAPFFGHEGEQQGDDVVIGGAGAIPALLNIAAWLDFREAFESAVAIGNHLVSRARWDTQGWWWMGGSPVNVRALTGFAHGAAGYGHALQELFAATGDSDYRYGAEQAFAYERSLFHPAAGNWPDLRHGDIAAKLATHETTEAFRLELAAGAQVPPYRTKFMVAWCHGAPGIGLSRLRAYTVFGDDVYRDEARIAAETTARSVRLGSTSSSLCHGLFGNCETLLIAASTLSHEPFRQCALDAIEKDIAGLDSRDGRWRAGTIDGSDDPSLLLGDAGPGLQLLRLHDPTIPSALALLAPKRSTAAPSPGPMRLHLDHVSRYFQRTLDVFARLRPDAPRLGQLPYSADRFIVAVAYDEIRRQIACEPRDDVRAMLDDAFRPERVRYECALELHDFIPEVLELRLRKPVALGEGVFQLASHVLVVESVYDWDAWLATESAPSAPPLAEPISFLVYRQLHEFHVQRIADFAALVVGFLREPRTLDELTTELVAYLEDNDPAETRAWRERLAAQLLMMLERGIVVANASATAVAPWNS